MLLADLEDILFVVFRRIKLHQWRIAFSLHLFEQIFDFFFDFYGFFSYIFVEIREELIIFILLFLFGDFRLMSIVKNFNKIESLPFKGSKRWSSAVCAFVANSATSLLSSIFSGVSFMQMDGISTIAIVFDARVSGLFSPNSWNSCMAMANCDRSRIPSSVQSKISLERYACELKENQTYRFDAPSRNSSISSSRTSVDSTNVIRVTSTISNSFSLIEEYSPDVVSYSFS